MEIDPRRSIARLAAAVMAADAHVTTTEIASLAGLVRLGLGNLEDLTREELLRASRETIDVGAACGELVARYPDAGATILAALAEIGASDGELDPREMALLARIAEELRVPAGIVPEIVRAVAGDCSMGRGAAPPAPPTPSATPREGEARRTPTPPLAAAYAILGVEPSASRDAVDAAYRRLVERYQPAQVIDLGPEFAVLAVRRLAAATAAYTAVLGDQGVV